MAFEKLVLLIMSVGFLILSIFILICRIFKKIRDPQTKIMSEGLFQLFCISFGCVISIMTILLLK